MEWAEYMQDLAEGLNPFSVTLRIALSVLCGGVLGLAIGILVPLLVAFTVCSIFKAQMKTAKMQQAAQEYIDGQGLVLTAQNDRFLHTTRTERYIEPPKSSGGTSVNSSGSSHSSGRF